MGVLVIILAVLAMLMLACSWLLYRIAFATGRAERGEPAVPEAPIYAAFHDRMAADTEELKAQNYSRIRINFSTVVFSIISS